VGDNIIMARKKGYHHSKLKDQRIDNLCRRFKCTRIELKRDHAEELSYPLYKHLNRMIKQDAYVHGLDLKLKKQFPELRNDIMQVRCYYCNRKLLCTKPYYEKKKGRIFCNNHCRDNCKHARARFIDNTLDNRRLTKIFMKEDSTVTKRLHVTIGKRIDALLNSKE